MRVKRRKKGKRTSKTSVQFLSRGVGKIFGENFSFGSEKWSRGDIIQATKWLERIHPLVRRPSNVDVVGGETRRVLLLYLLSLFSFFILGTRLIYLALFRGEEYLLAAEGNRIVAETIRPERGVVVDRKGEILATNVPGFRVVANPQICLLRCDLTFLANLLKMKGDSLEVILEDGREANLASVTLKGRISRDVAVRLEANMEKLGGVSVEAVPMRSYPYPYAVAHVLGYVGEISTEELERTSPLGYKLGDWVGKSGMESTYEEYLQGRAGRQVLEKDAAGRVVGELGRRDPQRGNTASTTLDLGLQRYVYRVLEEGVKEAGSSSGAAVVSNVKTGAILSLISYPSFDPGKIDKFLVSKDRPLFNRAITGVYPPGSTFKLITGSAGLEEGVINASTVIYDRGSISIGPYIFRGWNPSGLGPLSFVDALAWSSDIYFYTVAGGYGSQPGVGPVKLAEWGRKYGLGEPLGIDLPGEAGGIIPDPEWKRKVKGEAWFAGNTYHMGIGQGDVGLTPLQLNMVTTVIANGGKLLRPYLVSEVRGERGELIFSQEREVRRSGFISQKTLELLKRGMRKSVTVGPTFTARTSPISITGKTGTAENPFGDAHAWFTAFAPYNNPQIAVTVVVESGGEGTYTATPIVRKIMEWWFAKKR